MRLGVAHRVDHRKTVTGVRHVEVSDEDVEALSSDPSQSFCDAGGGDYLKSFAFQRRIHHRANAVILIHQRDSVRNQSTGGTHTALPLVTNDDNLTEVYFSKCTILTSC